MLEKELDAIYKVSRILGKSFDLNKTLSEVLQILNDVMGLTRGIVSISDKDNTEVKVTAVQGDVDWLKKQANGVMPPDLFV